MTAGAGHGVRTSGQEPTSFEISIARDERRLFIAIASVWCLLWLLIAIVLVLSDATAASLISVAAVLVGYVLARRILGLSVIVKSGELVVRNYIHTLNVSRSSIQGFDIHKRNDFLTNWPAFVIEATLVDGQSVRLKATRRSWFMSGAAENLNPQLSELKEWLDTTDFGQEGTDDVAARRGRNDARS
jgi:hypothetical protein